MVWHLVPCICLILWYPLCGWWPRNGHILLSFSSTCTFTLWLCPFLHQEVESSFHSLLLTWPWHVYWSTECGRSDVGVLCPGYKRLCWFVLSLSLAGQTAIWRILTLQSWEREATRRKGSGQQPALTIRHMSGTLLDHPDQVRSQADCNHITPDKTGRRNFQLSPAHLFNSRNLSK